MDQKPLLSHQGILVVAMATLMSMISGIAANRVSNPSRRSAPKTISTTPTKGAITPGAGMPMLVKRPTPRASGKRNFCMPSERKTPPTRKRTRMTAHGASIFRSSSRVVTNASDRECSILPRGAPVLFRRNQQEQSDAADDGEGRTVVEHGGVADPIPKQSGDDTGHELQQAHGGAVPADPAGAQMLRHEIRCKRLADGAKYSLKQPVEDKERGGEKDVLRQGKAEIGDQEDDKRGEQDVPPAPRVGKRPGRIGDQR